MQRQTLVLAATLSLVCTGCTDRTSYSSKQPDLKAFGLKTDRMNYFAAAQNASNWCWAACIQMVLSSHGVTISQEEIVREAFGLAVNAPANGFVIDAVLNCERRDRRGRACRISSKGNSGPPPLEFLVQQLQHDAPVIVGYTPAGAPIGHAVIVTAVIVEQGAAGTQLVRMVVRDPWPSYSDEQGKRVMTPAEYRAIHGYHMISIAARD